MPKQTTLDGTPIPPPPRLYRDPNEPFFRALRTVAYRVLVRWWREYGAGILRDTLINLTYAELKNMQLNGNWKYPMPKRETLRKRVNELLEKHVVGDPPLAFAVPIKLQSHTTTIYFPHPENMPEPDRSEIYKQIREWRRGE